MIYYRMLTIANIEINCDIHKIFNLEGIVWLENVFLCIFILSCQSKQQSITT